MKDEVRITFSLLDFLLVFSIAVNRSNPVSFQKLPMDVFRKEGSVKKKGTRMEIVLSVPSLLRACTDPMHIPLPLPIPLLLVHRPPRGWAARARAQGRSVAA